MITTEIIEQRRAIVLTLTARGWPLDAAGRCAKACVERGLDPELEDLEIWIKENL